MDSEYEYRNGRHGIFSYSVSCQGSHVSKGCAQYKIDVNLEMGRHDRRIVCVVLLSEEKLIVGTTLLHLVASKSNFQAETNAKNTNNGTRGSHGTPPGARKQGC